MMGLPFDTGSRAKPAANFSLAGTLDGTGIRSDTKISNGTNVRMHVEELEDRLVGMIPTRIRPSFFR